MNKQLTAGIGTLGHELIRRIEKVAGIEGVYADLYIADVEMYVDMAEADKIRAYFLKKYGLSDKLLPSYMTHWPIALICLYVLEHGKYDIKILDIKP